MRPTCKIGLESLQRVSHQTLTMLKLINQKKNFPHSTL